ncbi:MAG TPA: transglycosylase family protein [Acidimicrobiales bacterium]|nr:transglycosylase family protein [Acidimicrobiales bacterium]
MVLLALFAGAGTAGAGQIEDKRAQAAAIIAKLEDQARAIVAADKEHRRAQEDLASAEAAVARAEADLASAGRRQDEARRLLTAHAQAAYVGGGSVPFLAQMTRATVLDAGARRTYLRVLAGEDRQAISRLKASRQDMEVRRRALEAARKAAAQRSDATVADLEGLEKAMAAQRALLGRVNGELGTLVAAEQARRDAEAAPVLQPAAAGAATATVPAPAATTAPRPGASTTAAPPTTAAPSAKLPANASDEATFACIRQLESGNNYKSPGGGAYQFQDATWRSLGYTGSAQDHPPEVQDEAARQLKARDGWRPWTTAPMCGKV